MPVRFVQGDLLRHHPGLDALAHGCNCAGAFGLGDVEEHVPMGAA